MLSEVYKEYGPYFYLPMTQGYSLAVPVTIGCSWNQCLYCDLNHDHEFRYLGLTEIEKKLKTLQTHYAMARRPLEKAVMAGGNPFCLDTASLLQIASLIKGYFPQVKNISAFARADDILRKSRDELLELKRCGIGELSVGVESGNDEILAFHRKGVTRDEIFQALTRLDGCGMTYSTYIMLGLGGKRLSRENALDTASLLTKVNPAVITAVTLVLFKDARLIAKVKSREFIRLNALESIGEEKVLLEHLEMRNTLFNGTHKTNALILKGRLPEQKSLLLNKINRALEGEDPRTLMNHDRLKWRNWSVE